MYWRRDGLPVKSSPCLCCSLVIWFCVCWRSPPQTLPSCRALGTTPSGRLYEGNRWGHALSETSGFLLSLLQSREAPLQDVDNFLHSRLAAAPVAMVVAWPLFQSSWSPPTLVTVLLIDFCSGFGSLALGCLCVAVCVEHNKEFAEVAQASIPQSVHQEFSLTSWTEKRSPECSRADPFD